VYLVGQDEPLVKPPAGLRRVRLADEEAVAAAHRRVLREHGGAIDTLVVANPADTAEGMGGLAALAPWVAVQRRAALVLTGPAGTDVDAVVAGAVLRESLRRADNLILLANLKAVPWQRRPNP